MIKGSRHFIFVFALLLFNNLANSQAITSIAVSGVNLIGGTKSGICIISDNGGSITEINIPDIEKLKVSVRTVAMNGSTILVGTESNGAFISVDSGVSWKQTSKLFFNEDTYISTVFLYGQTAFVCAGKHAYSGKTSIYFSESDGESWTKIEKGFKNMNIKAIVNDGTTLYAGGSYDKAINPTEMFVSTDQGKKWKKISMGLGNGTVTQIAISSSAILVGAKDNGGLSSGGIYLFDKNISTWSYLGMRDVMAVTICGTDFYIATKEVGIHKSSDNGKTWKAMNNGIPNIDKNFYITTLATIGTNIFALTSTGRLMISVDNGNTWEKCKIDADIKMAQKIEGEIDTRTYDANTDFAHGLAQLKYKNLKDALTYFNKAIAIIPEFAEAYKYRSLCNKMLNFFDDAKKDSIFFEKFKRPETFLNLALIQNGNDKIDERFNYLQLYLKTSKKEMTFNSRKEEIMGLNAFSISKGTNQWKSLIELKWSEKDIVKSNFIESTKLLNKLNDRVMKLAFHIHAEDEVYIKYFNKEEQPLYKVALEKIERGMSRSSESSRNDDLKDAIKLLTLAISQNVNEADYYIKRGHAYTQLHQFSSAKDDFEKAKKINPKCGSECYNAGFYMCSECNGKGKTYIKAKPKEEQKTTTKTEFIATGDVYGGLSVTTTTTTGAGEVNSCYKCAGKGKLHISATK